MSTPGIAKPADVSRNGWCPPATFATLLRVLVVFAGFGGLAYFSATLATLEGRIAAVWLPNAVLLALLLRRQSRSDWILLAAGLAGNILANHLAGDGITRAVWLSFANTVEIVMVWKAFTRFTSGFPDMTKFDHFTRFCTIALVAPVVSAVVALPLLRPANLAATVNLATSWLAVDTLSLILLTPTLLILADAWQARRRPSMQEVLDWVGVLTIGTALTLYVFLQNTYPYLFMGFAVVLLSTFRLGAPGTAIAILKIYVIGSVATFYGDGPINLVSYGMAEKLLTLQFFLAVSFGMGLPVAAVLKRGKSAETERVALEARFRQLVEVAPVGIFRTDATGKLIEVNPAWLKIAGLRDDAWSDNRWTRAIHPDEVARVGKKWSQAISDRTPFHEESRFGERDGPVRWVTAAATPEYDHTGNLIGFVGTISDTTERKLAEMELLEARERAERAVEVKSAFLANMSHEIRTPMNGMLGFTELLLADQLSDSQRRAVEMIAESGRAMMRLLNDILDISKIEAGMMNVASEPLDVRERVDSITSLMHPIATAKGLQLSFAVATAVPEYVLGDPLRVRQILLNLVANAVKFTERGFVAVDVGVGHGATGDTLEFTVRDTGIGISPEALEAVFDKFTQADTSTARTYGGTGLGLAISANLAKLLGGSLTAESTVGEGSVFRLSLPLNAVGAAPRMELAYLADGTAVALSGPRVLIAEDHEINQHLIMAMAARVGLDADLARDGAEAIAMVAAAEAAGKPYGLVLMDMQMPVVDGLEATRRLRQIGYNAKQLPIIALTANAYPEDVATCLKAGMQAHLSKPVRLRQLSDLVAIYAQETPGKPDEATLLYTGSLAKRYENHKHDILARVRRLRQASDVPAQELTQLLAQLQQLAATARQFAEIDVGLAAGELEQALRDGGPAQFSTVMACQGVKLLRAA